MNTVQFLKGKFENLRKVPLTPGAIYFTEDTRRLFIDTDTARLPVASDQMAGKIFWVRLKSSNWTELTQTVSLYYDQQEERFPYDLSDLITEDSIMFLGKITYDTPNEDGIQPAVVSSEVTNSSITFRCFNVDPASTKAPTSDMWVQIYCPNPKVESLVAVDVFRSVFTTRVRMSGNAWVLQGGKYTYTISIPGVDFSQHPFIANLSDDSLENRFEFQRIKMDNNGADIIFTSESNIQFNIEVDICIWLGPGAIAGQILDMNQTAANEVDWIVTTLAGTKVQNRKVTVNNAGTLPPPEDGKERFLISFCTTNANKDYAKVENIEYENGNLIFTFKEGTTQLDTGFTCVVIQLNNIANIREGTLQARINVPSGDAPTYDGWMEVTSQMQYYGQPGEILPPEFVNNRTTKFYSQYWPEPSQESDLLSLKHLPLVMPKHKKDVARFAKLCETKLYSNRIQFFIKEKYLNEFASDIYDQSKDLELIIIDFK